MAGPSDYYQILEVDNSADAATIKAAYRRLARQYHPDVNPGNKQAETRFKQIGEAYATLSDPTKRLAYDQSIGLVKQRSPRGNSPSPQTSAPSPATSSKSQWRDGAAQKKAPPRSKASSMGTTAGASAKAGSKSTVDTSGTGFKEMFDSLFRKEEGAPQASPSPTAAKSPEAYQPYEAPKAAKPKPVRGEDITIDLFLRSEETQQGVVKTVSVQHTERCKRCSGTGRVSGIICSLCQGEKQSSVLRKIDVKVPVGVKIGSKIRIAKEGGRGLNGGDSGDLFLVVRQESDQALKIEGLTVSSDMAISIPQAVLGAEVEVTTLHGKLKMLIPPLTPSEKVFKLKGQGVTLNGVTGDHYVTVHIVPPKTLSTQERELYEALGRLDKP